MAPPIYANGLYWVEETDESHYRVNLRINWRDAESRRVATFVFPGDPDKGRDHAVAMCDRLGTYDRR